MRHGLRYPAQYLTYRVPTIRHNPPGGPLRHTGKVALQHGKGIAFPGSSLVRVQLYNTEHWLCKQYGQAIVVLSQLEDSDYLVDKCQKLYPLEDLAPKYKRFLADIKPRTEPGTVV